jgi:hypothetical protein
MPESSTTVRDSYQSPQVLDTLTIKLVTWLTAHYLCNDWLYATKPPSHHLASTLLQPNMGQCSNLVNLYNLIMLIKAVHVLWANIHGRVPSSLRFVHEPKAK